MKILMIVFAALFSLNACSKVPTSEKMVGHWRYSDNVKKSVCDLIFKNDGTFSGTVAVEGKVVWEFAGKWSLQKRLLNYEYTVSSEPKIPVGKKDQDKIFEVTPTYFICKDTLLPLPKRKYIRVN